MSSITSLGRSSGFPVLENMAFFKGFQNPRIPSYFSNTHLMISALNTKTWNHELSTNSLDRFGSWWRNKDWWVLQCLQFLSHVLQRNPQVESHWSLPHPQHSTSWKQVQVDWSWWLLQDYLDHCKLRSQNKRHENIKQRKWPLMSVVPPTRNNNQSDSILFCKLLFQLISSFDFFQGFVAVWCVFEIMVSLLSTSK